MFYQSKIRFANTNSNETLRPSVNQAFTLVELLVVIAILGIIAALLLPLIASAKSRAHATNCKSRLRQLGLGLQMYVQENQGRYPRYRDRLESGTMESTNSYDTRRWWGKLLPYYPIKWTERAYHCPAYQGAITQATDRHAPLGSYAYNWLGVTPPVGPYAIFTNNIIPRNYGLPPTPEAHVKSPSEMLAVSESRFLNQRVNGIPGGEDSLTCGILKWPDNSATAEFAFDPKRHGKNYNLLFCDGHVSAMDPWLLFNPTNSAAIWNFDHQPHPEVWFQE